jgi:hypothetical protein
MDDILVYSKSLVEHAQHLEMVFKVLQSHKLYAKRSKCVFAVSKVEYLGHTISSEGVATDEDKVQAVLQWPLPTTVTELRGFLGLTGYYRKFVQHYSIIAKPLTNLLKKKSFAWTADSEKAFNTLKQALVNTPVLALPDFSLPFCLETDACATGIGAILSQQGHPIAFLGKALCDKNQKLSIYEKEFLAIMLAVTRWRPYLQNGPFVIKTGHKSLCYLENQVLGSDLQKKAMTKLIGLQYSFKYNKGVDNVAADALSRVGHFMQLSAVSVAQPMEVLNSYEMDPTAQELLKSLAITTADHQGYLLQDGLIRYQGKFWVGGNSGLQTKIIQAFHSAPVGGHSGMLATYQRVKKHFTWSGLKPGVENFVKQCQVYQQAKHEHCKLPGLLSPLQPPDGAWQAISMDFVEGLPTSQGYNCILVVVDRFTKYSHFIPLKHPFTASYVAKEFMDKVVKLHCIPVSIVSDRDKVFTSNFWRELFHILDTELQMSSAYHPQTDGQTERTNQCLEMYLRCAIHDQPKKWSQWLPLAELWFNTSHHTALGCSPFKALYGHEPNIGFVPAVPNTTNTDLFELLQEPALFTEFLRSQLQRAQQRMKLGDSVFLKLQPYTQSSVASRPCPKLAYKFYGPFKILSRIGSAAYKLELPPSSTIHPVFHVSQLKTFVPDHTPVFSFYQFQLSLMRRQFTRRKYWNTVSSSAEMLLISRLKSNGLSSRWKWQPGKTTRSSVLDSRMHQPGDSLVLKAAALSRRCLLLMIIMTRTDNS